MKYSTLLYLAVILFISSCSDEISFKKQAKVNAIELFYNSARDSQIAVAFTDLINGITCEDNSITISKCNRFLRKEEIPRSGFFEDKIVVKIGERLYGKPDHHFSTYFDLKKINNDTIFFDWHIAGMNLGIYHKEQGEFGFIQNDSFLLTPYFMIGEEKINKELATKHIKNGYVYLLINTDNFSIKYGASNPKTECYVEAIEKFGFEIFFVVGCAPTQSYLDQINEYNSCVFEYLKNKKHFKSDSWNRLIGEQQREATICLNTKNRMKNNQE